MAQHLRSPNISIFLSKNSNFCYIRKYRPKLIFDTFFLTHLTLSDCYGIETHNHLAKLQSVESL